MTRAERPGDGRGARGGTTVLAWVLPHLLAHLQARGLDAGVVRNLPGLRAVPLDDPDARVSDAAAREAWHAAARLAGDPAFGLHMAEAVPAGAFDLYEYAFRSSATLAEGLEQLARYGHLLNDRAAARVARDANGDLRVAVGRPAGPPQPQRTEFALALLVRLAREGTGIPLAPRSVAFAHAAPDDTLEHRRLFRSAVSFGAGRNELVFSAEDAARRLASSDPVLASVVRRRLSALMDPASGGTAADAGCGPTAARVRARLLDATLTSCPTSAATARELGLGPRTLTRRLAAEGTSFRELLDGVRCEAATSLLRDPAVAIAEIAYLLGYSEAAAFHRSFRRWTGRTPLAYRRESVAPGAR